MYHFLEIMNKISAWKSIRIQQFVDDEENAKQSWIYKLWTSTEKDKLISEYSKHQMKIKFDQIVVHEEDLFGSWESFVIVRDSL